MPTFTDRIAETWSGTGTGTITLSGVAVSGPPGGYRAFSGNVTNGATVRILIEHQGTTEWEISEGVYNSGAGTVTRATVKSSSNAGSLVNFSAGVKHVAIVDDAAWMNSVVIVGGALGTPASGVLTNCTGLPTAGLIDGAVTLAKMANMATASLIYRKTAGSGAPEVNTLATLKTDLGLTGTNTGDQTSVTGNAGTVTVADAGADTTCWVLLGTSQTGSLAPATDAALTYNASSNLLTAGDALIVGATTYVAGISREASNEIVNLELNYNRLAAQNTGKFGGAFTIDTRNPTADLFHWRVRNTAGTEIQPMSLTSDGALLLANAGLVIGAPTGGDKGTGTINCAADIYKNNTAYTSPDYVFEHFFSGKIERYKDNDGAAEYNGLVSLAEIEEFARENYHLPQVSREASGIFTRADKMLELIESLYLYAIDADKRIKELESRVS